MRGRLLAFCFALALAVNVSYTLVGLASIPAYYERVTTQTIEPYALAGITFISNEMVAKEAAERGLSLPAYAGYQVVLNSGLALAALAVAAVVVWRARGWWFAWYSAFIIVFLGEYALAQQVYAARLIPVEWYEVGAIFWFLLLPYLYLFPNGKPVPRRALWLVGPLALSHFAVQALGVLLVLAPGVVGLTPADWRTLGGLITGAITLNFVVVFACQAYRYLRVSTPVERQQTKWFLFGFGLLIATFPVESVTRGNGGFVDDLIGAFLLLLLPVTIAVAILRYRLWDIDLIINRVLVYGALTVTLGLSYFGGVAAVQATFSSLTGQERQPQLAVVVTTLLIAALFNPLRRRLQGFIDRRFYRKRYDARKTLAAFSARLRDEVDLNGLTTGLVAVVEDTMQPAHVSVWLRSGPEVSDHPAAEPAKKGPVS
jgi:hypothetical protein